MLTHLSCKALITSSKKQNKPLKKADRNGLFIHAFPSGAAFLKHKYRFRGVPKEISYGPYPLITLQEARQHHAESYKQIRGGIDPSKLRQEQAKEAKAESLNTFEHVAREWYQHNVENWSQRHARRLKNRLEKNLIRPFRKRPIRELSRKELLTELCEIEKRSKEAAKRCAQYLLGIFRYALDEEFIETNGALDLQTSLKPYKQGHYPAMHIDDLPAFLNKLHGPIRGNAEDKRDVLELIMLTLVRSMELLSAEWHEFNFETDSWIIPAAKMKMRKPHVVPLSRQSKAILLRRWNRNFHKCNTYPSKYLFPSRVKAGIHLCHTTGSDTLIEMGYSGIHTCHGFRSLGMGIAKERLGYRHEVPNKQLAHEAENDVDRAYDRADFMKERTEMMQQLADYISNIQVG